MKQEYFESNKQVTTPVFTASNRPSYRHYFKGEKSAQWHAETAANGNDSISHRAIDTVSTGKKAAKNKRLTKAQLTGLFERLSDRDRAVLTALKKYRFLTSDQIGRLFVTNSRTKTSQTRQRNLLLQRLGGHGLIRPLSRRVGGFGGGSSVQVWHLSEAGHRLLCLNDPDGSSRKRFMEPSTLFLNHTLAIAECAVQLIYLCKNSTELALETVETEPSCWRGFRANGHICHLKPDLFAITSYDGYEDRWFIEMDLGSVSTAQIVEKCNAYLRYYHTGIEQMETEMFPLVVWIVRDASRKNRLRECIREGLSPHPKMFLVIEPNELEKMLRQYIDAKELL